MDIVHAGFDVAGLMRHTNPILPRVCITGPLRQTKNAFVRECLTQPWVPDGVTEAAIAAAATLPPPHTVLDLGGGQGGDCHHWVQTPGIWHIDVVDVDSNALEEYARRLASTYRARLDTEGGWMFPQDGRRMCLHRADARSLPRGLAEGREFCLMEAVGCLSLSDRQPTGAISPLPRSCAGGVTWVPCCTPCVWSAGSSASP